MSSDSISTTREHKEYMSCISAMPFADLMWLAHQITDYFSEDDDRDYEDVPTEEQVRMAKALVLAAENIRETGSCSEP